MKVLIENYRNHEIHFDTDENSFIAISDKYDRQFEKKSYSGAKKEIDEYIKENVCFNPVVIQNDDNKIITLVAIRKDGGFVFNNKGVNEKLSIYDEKEFFIFNENNEPIFKEIADKKSKIESIRKEISSLIKTLKMEDLGLKELKSTYTV